MSDFQKIKAFAMDVDGVMTNGGILADNEGQLYRTFDSKDGFGVRMARMHDYPVGIITGGRAQSICARMKTIGVPPEDVYLGSRNKMEDFEDSMKNVWSSTVCKDTIDEAPMAYKDMSEIVANIEPTAEIVNIIKPIFNFKAAE